MNPFQRFCVLEIFSLAIGTRKTYSNVFARFVFTSPMYMILMILYYIGTGLGIYTDDGFSSDESIVYFLYFIRSSSSEASLSVQIRTGHHFSRRMDKI